MYKQPREVLRQIQTDLQATTVNNAPYLFQPGTYAVLTGKTVNITGTDSDGKAIILPREESKLIGFGVSLFEMCKTSWFWQPLA